jgi:hypothetical protein
MNPAPVVFQWTGEAMVPLARFHNVANAQFTVGEYYRMEALEERSLVSHRHFFACVHDAWLNLPDKIAVDFPTDDALRKHALILTGFREERKFVASSPIEARKIAAFIKPRDEYAIISVNGNIVIEWTAKSQSMKAMGKQAFADSKDKVLGFVADLIGVAPETLAANARRAA